jgi:hypothetical protein
MNATVGVGRLVFFLSALAALALAQPYATAQSAADDIVLWASSASPADVRGDWHRVAEPSAAGGAFLYNPDRGRARVSPARSAPTDYFEMRFSAKAGTAYHLWIRMGALNNSVNNDSVHVQFSDSVNAQGQSIARIGTTNSAEVVLQDGVFGLAPAYWGWADNGWGVLGTPIYFANDGTHVVRVQSREDGPGIDQIVLSPVVYATTRPGATHYDGTILAASGWSGPVGGIGSSVIIRAARAAAGRMFGAWQTVSDATAADGQALRNPNQSAAKIAPALANPASYFEATFNAAPGRAYHVWIRMRADGNSTSNDSVHVQFSDSVTSSGAATARIGTASSLEVVLQQNASAAAPRGWGWADNGWGALGSHIYFAGSGTHTIRVQQREDGAVIDQIVISPDVFLTSPPGWRLDDATILPASAPPASTNLPPTVTLTAPASGASYTAPATISITATAADPENKLAKVEFFNGSALLGTDTTAPFSFSWSAVPAGTYQVKAVATDTSGATATSTVATVTVAGASPSPIRVAFIASATHSTVTRYALDVFAATANPSTATPIATSDLGKPAPNSAGEIVVDRTTFLNGLATGNYQITIAAINSSGTSRSAAIPFTR